MVSHGLTEAMVLVWEIVFQHQLVFQVIRITGAIIPWEMILLLIIAQLFMPIVTWSVRIAHSNLRHCCQALSIMDMEAKGFKELCILVGVLLLLMAIAPKLT